MKPGLGARAQAFALLALVATSGALAGIVGDRALAGRRAGEPVATPADVPPPLQQPGGRYAERLAETLELTPAQAGIIDEIVAEEQARVRDLTEEVQPRFRAITEDTRDRIESVLTPEQRQKLVELRTERMRAMGGARNGRGPAPRWLREGPGRDAPMRRPPPPLQGRDSIMRERRLEFIRMRDSILRETRDSIMRERHNLQPSQLDSLMHERRERMRQRFEALRDSLRTAEGGGDGAA